MPYSIQYADRRGRRQLSGLPILDQARLHAAIQALASEPRPAGVRKLREPQSGYRVRVGNYRIIYEVDDVNLIVWIASLTRRNESTYR